MFNIFRRKKKDTYKTLEYDYDYSDPEIINLTAIFNNYNIHPDYVKYRLVDYVNQLYNIDVYEDIEYTFQDIEKLINQDSILLELAFYIPGKSTQKVKKSIGFSSIVDNVHTFKNFYKYDISINKKPNKKIENIEDDEITFYKNNVGFIWDLYKKIEINNNENDPKPMKKIYYEIIEILNNIYRNKKYETMLNYDGDDIIFNKVYREYRELILSKIKKIKNLTLSETEIEQLKTYFNKIYYNNICTLVLSFGKQLRLLREIITYDTTGNTDYDVKVLLNHNNATINKQFIIMTTLTEKKLYSSDDFPDYTKSNMIEKRIYEDIEYYDFFYYFELIRIDIKNNIIN